MSVDLPLPLGPTKAIVSPILTSKAILSMALWVAVLCLKLTSLNASLLMLPNGLGLTGVGSGAFVIRL